MIASPPVKRRHDLNNTSLTGTPLDEYDGSPACGDIPFDPYRKQGARPTEKIPKVLTAAAIGETPDD